MSCNIDSHKLIKSDGYILAKDVINIYNDYEDEFPESCFIYELVDEAEDAILAGEPNREIKLNDFSWSGTRSGSYFDVLINEIASYIKGEIGVIFIWDTGELEGYFIKDGKTVRCEIKMELVKPNT